MSVILNTGGVTIELNSYSPDAFFDDFEPFLEPEEVDEGIMPMPKNNAQKEAKIDFKRDNGVKQDIQLTIQF